MTKIYFMLYFRDPPIAQLVEQLALNEKVLGSIPSGRTHDEKTVPSHCLFALVRDGGMFLQQEKRPSRAQVGIFRDGGK